ncbi:uncharacterized protein METZ01_LOCUS211786 [marine metagenome]|uniref:Zinc ABC transporter substrate-binding protein n=1 Tax=marine metagenome TaxID=408172 RepID=A0A382F8H3_9ZZZZ
MRLLMLALIVMVTLPAIAAGPRVVVSLKPIHGLVADVMKGVGEPYLLLTASADPHSHALRPSEARKLVQADVVFWVGSNLEGFLRKPLLNLPSGSRVVPLLRNPRLLRLKQRQGGIWKIDDPDRNQAGEFDPHFWLDPRNARIIVWQIVEVLSQIDPDNAANYEINGKRLGLELTRLAHDIDELLAPVRTLPYFVLHDAYQYFEFRFQTHGIGAIALDHDHKPGARRIAMIRQRLRAGGARCLFQEAEFSSKMVTALTEGTTTRVGVLDPIGKNVHPGPGAYSRILRDLADNLKKCLSYSTDAKK